METIEVKELDENPTPAYQLRVPEHTCCFNVALWQRDPEYRIGEFTNLEDAKDILQAFTGVIYPDLTLGDDSRRGKNAWFWDLFK